MLFVLLSDAEYLGLALGACSLSRRPAVLHLYDLGTADLHLLAALHTISLHSDLLHEDS